MTQHKHVMQTARNKAKAKRGSDPKPKSRVVGKNIVTTHRMFHQDRPE